MKQTTIPHLHPGSRSQTGAALAISLIMLLLLTIIGITAMQSTTLQERMAGNIRDRNIAFQAAEAALRDAEIFLSAATVPNFDGTNGLYQPPAPASTPLWKSIDWSSGSAVRNYPDTIPSVSSQPKYIIEELAYNPSASGGSLASDEPIGTSKFYRITARAVGATDSTVVMLTSVYRR